MSKHIAFFEERKAPLLRSLKRLPQWIEGILQQEQCIATRIHYTFVDDDALLDLNRRFLQHDTYTDILTFQYATHPVEGDIYISYDRVIDNAIRFGVSTKQELLRVIAHGALHLCGWADKNKAASELMRKREDACLALYLQA